MTTPNNTVAGLPAKMDMHSPALIIRYGVDYLDGWNSAVEAMQAALASPAPSAPSRDFTMERGPDGKETGYALFTPSAGVVDEAMVTRGLCALVPGATIEGLTWNVASFIEQDQSLFPEIDRRAVIRAALTAALAGVSAPVGVEGVEGLVAKWRGRADNITAADDYNTARKNTYEHCADQLEDALTPPAAAPRVEERCESSDPDCGPVEFHDDDDTPLCRKCYEALEPETKTQRKARELGIEVVATPAASEASPAEQVGEDGLEDRVNALYDELFCTGKHLHAKVPIDPKEIIRRALATAEQPGSAVQGDRELIRRLYVELLWCDRQLVGRGCKQGGSVRDVLADALEYLKSTPPPAEQAQPEARGVEGMVLVPRHYAENVGYAAAVLEQAESVIDRNNAPPLRKLAAMLASAPAAPGAAVGVDPYEKGWINAAKWAQRVDLISDIGSTAYERDKTAALAHKAQEESNGK